MLTFLGFLFLGAGWLAALAAHGEFSWGMLIAAVLLIALGVWLIRQGRRAAANEFGGDGPDLFDLLDAAGDAADLFDD